MGFIAMRIDKPVKWIESRRENFQCTIHGRGHVDYFELAAKRDGTMLGLKLKLIQDLGAYHQLLTPAIPTLSVLMMPGPLPVQEHLGGHRRRLHQLRSHRRLSRRRPSRGHPRHRAHGGHAGRRIEDGPGRDPAEELRRATTSFPIATATGLVYDSGNYAAPLHKALAAVDYTELRGRSRPRRAKPAN